jgi:predicted NBD/HSP70 family sugar kinase
VLFSRLAALLRGQPGHAVAMIPGDITAGVNGTSMRADPGRITIGFAAPRRGPGGGSADVTRAQLFAEVLTGGPLSRTELALRTELSQSTVTKMVNPLIEAGYIVETGAASSGAGRPRQLLRVAAERYVVLGVKIAPGAVTGVLADLEARVSVQRQRPLPHEHQPAQAIQVAADVVADLLGEDEAGRGQVLGVGVGVGGHVDRGTGRVIQSGILGWSDVPLAEPLAAATGFPVVVGNDVDTLAIAERWFGHGRGIRSFALVTVGPGIGSAFLLDGEPLTGASGLSGELGHIPVRPGGRRCGCGNRGCLETVASDDAVLRDIAERGGPAYRDIGEAVEGARSGSDPVAESAFQSMGAELGRALATVCNLFNPGRIVLTGERASAFDLFGPACEQAWRSAAFSTAASDCELVVDSADDTLWARGAGCLVIREAVGATAAPARGAAR